MASTSLKPTAFVGAFVPPESSPRSTEPRKRLTDREAPRSASRSAGTSSRPNPTSTKEATHEETRRSPRGREERQLTIHGGKLAQQTAGKLGFIHAVKVDTGAPVEPTTTRVGEVEPVAIIPPRNTEPSPIGKWPTDNADTNKAIHEMLVPSRKDATA